LLLLLTVKLFIGLTLLTLSLQETNRLEGSLGLDHIGTNFVKVLISYLYFGVFTDGLV
jgi:hypothetical protein